MIGNISKSKGFKGDRGYIGIQGIQGIQGEKGDTANIYLRYDASTGNLYYSTEYVPSLKTAPYIGENGNWYVFDGKEKIFIDTGINAQGGVPTQYIDEYIDEQTAIIKSDIEGLQKQIQEESHFRGYLSTNAKIQALEATPNDFAYSAESGTVWIYDAEQGWQNTSTPVPDKGTPLSNATPLINGIASAGTSEEGARSDHRHPTDTTRASAEDVRLIDSRLWRVEDNMVELEYMVSDMQVTVEDYSSATTIDLILEHNSLYYCDVITAFNLAISSDINIEDVEEPFECSILFTSDPTGTNLDYSASPIIWSGDDCDSDGHFVPEPNKTYEISIKKLGLIISARVGVI